MRLSIIIPHLLFFSFAAEHLFGQELYAINATWSDSFVEWSFVSTNEEEGNFSVRWPNREYWSEWVFDYDGYSGTLKMKWDNNPNIWELRYGGEVVNIKTKWRNDFSEWRISDGTSQLTFASRYTNNISEWRLKEKRLGIFNLKTEWENDPRDWNIYDELDESITIGMKLAMTFIAIINSIPRV